jgi:hypothetical protein
MPNSEIFKELVGPLSTFIPSIAAIYISWFISSTQTRWAEAKFSFDIFNKRYEIYEATRSLIDRVREQDHAKLHPRELRALHLKIGEACFFFDEATQMFLEEIWSVSDRILLTRDQRKLIDEGSDEWLALGNSLSADDAKLSAMYSKLLPTFGRSMALTQLPKLRGG